METTAPRTTAIGPARARRAGWAVVVALALCAPAGRAAAAAPPPRVPLAEMSWYGQLWHDFESSLTTRAGMMRFGAIGMALALFIIWYRRP